uniref:Uncharacterized protein n=1 Tax=Onchocerca volvulus TaxID=6282 RepID=A0A8R1Y2F3_ONCVO
MAVNKCCIVDYIVVVVVWEGQNYGKGKKMVCMDDLIVKSRAGRYSILLKVQQKIRIISCNPLINEIFNNS